MLKAYYQISTFGKDKVKKTRKRLSRSFLAQFIQLSYLGHVGNALFNIIDTGDSVRSVRGNSPRTYFNSNAPWGNTFSRTYPYAGNSPNTSDSYGIKLGTGVLDVTPTDTKLQIPIVHGTGSGQIEYLGHFFPMDITTSGSNSYFVLERLFYNSSNGDIVVNEMGIYSVEDNVGYVFCIVRDIVVPGVTVHTGEYLKVAYTIQVSC